MSTTFGKYDSTMKGVKWGLLYNVHKDDNLETDEIQKQIGKLMSDKEVQNKKGIYEYILSGDEKVLNLKKVINNNKREDKTSLFSYNLTRIIKRNL